ncbi:MAG TPA: ATP-binding protein [Solirubrobacteraceae bacterium]|nr:ATP-binding protein [Solirubrobacteraceae bacterium]
MARGDGLSKSYPALPESVPVARRALAAVAVAAGAAGERLEEIRLAVSEALTNAVVHGYRNGDAGRLHVTAAVTSGELWILIGDDGRGMHAWNDSSGLGIGLSLISGLSDDFAILTRASGGTEVQMRFDLNRAGVVSPVVNREDRAARQPRQPDLASQR